MDFSVKDAEGRYAHVVNGEWYTMYVFISKKPEYANVKVRPMLSFLFAFSNIYTQNKKNSFFYNSSRKPDQLRHAYCMSGMCISVACSVVNVFSKNMHTRVTRLLFTNAFTPIMCSEKTFFCMVKNIQTKKNKKTLI